MKSLSPNWVKRDQNYIPCINQEEFVYEVTFSKYCSFDSCGDVVNPKLVRKKSPNPYFFPRLGLTPFKAKQPLRDMELLEKEAQKIKTYGKSV